MSWQGIATLWGCGGRQAEEEAIGVRPSPLPGPARPKPLVDCKEASRAIHLCLEGTGQLSGQMEPMEPASGGSRSSLQGRLSLKFKSFVECVAFSPSSEIRNHSSADSEMCGSLLSPTTWLHP